jgi:hypothetical protein
MLYTTLRRLQPPSLVLYLQREWTLYRTRFTRFACTGLLALTIGLSAFGAQLFTTYASTYALHLLSSHHLYSPALLAGGGCGAATTDC